MSAPPPGALIAGRYQVQRELGAGGFGQVLLATDRELARAVAIKRLHPELADPESFARLVREAKATAALDHPAIVRVYDHGRDGDGRPFIVYEYVEGRPATALRDAPEPPALARVAALGRTLAEALAAAHGAGVLHRDVKPDNILVRPDGSPVLLDFGIARLAHDRSVKTGTGLILGTPGYLAPEVWRGAEPSPAADQYALAATLYELAYGRPLHPDPSASAVASRVLDGFASPFPPPPGRERSPAFEATLARALAPEPAQRHPDLTAFAAALATVATPPAIPRPPAPGALTQKLAPAPIPAGPGTLAQAPRPTSRGPGPLGAGLVLCALLWGAFAATRRAPDLPPAGGPPPLSPAGGEPDEELDTAWRALSAAREAIPPGGDRDANGMPARLLEALVRRTQIIEAPGGIADARYPYQVRRFLEAFLDYLDLALDRPYADRTRIRIWSTILVQFCGELRAQSLIADALNRTGTTLLAGLPVEAPFGSLAPPQWKTIWNQLMEEYRGFLARIPVRREPYALELDLLEGEIRACLAEAPYEQALGRLLRHPPPPEERGTRGTQVEILERLVRRIHRSGSKPCAELEAAATWAARHLGVARELPEGPRLGELGRVLRVSGLAGRVCPPLVARLAPLVDGALAAVEEHAGARELPAMLADLYRRDTSLGSGIEQLAHDFHPDAWDRLARLRAQAAPSEP